ncbi:hypothetical protein SAMN05660209_01013 [Geodermatophilus africanus]|uniref:Uncharacterized protein n=1 Tax=Geodermatophilus africanus TaxID=1137993 RepID=A0A1H3DL81_9ACTN|nr:hypothetical protein [Geodermatophilus africanus]SDX66404.1 hypothetical protein SAMN05660209_01013 [Geodermatophilus africanus]
MAQTRDLRRGFAAVTTTADRTVSGGGAPSPRRGGTWDRGLRSAELDGPFVVWVWGE